MYKGIQPVTMYCKRRERKKKCAERGKIIFPAHNAVLLHLSRSLWKTNKICNEQIITEQIETCSEISLKGSYLFALTDDLLH